MIIAGSCCSGYDPLVIFRERIHKGIVIGLHKGYSIKSIAKLLNVPKRDVEGHLRYLREMGFVTEKEGRIVPAFFIALREDARRTRRAAKRLGRLKLGSSIRLIGMSSWRCTVSSPFHLDSALTGLGLF